MAGLSERSRQGYLAILERLRQPDHGGLDDTFYDGTRLNILYAVALTEAIRGYKSALTRIEEFDTQPLFQVSGWRVRMVYYIGQGNTQKAIQCKERLELLQIQNSPLQFFEGTHVYIAMLAYALSDDLAGIQQTMETIENMAKRFEPWRPIFHYARGEYHRIRGDYPSAISDLETALKEAAPGRNLVWPNLAACAVVTLLELGRVREAKERGAQFVKQGEDETSDITLNYVRTAFAWAEAKSGEYASAIEQMDLVIRLYLAAEATGINLGIAYEMRARIAVLMNDHESFKHFAELCSEQFKAGRNPALTAKYEKLIQEARQAKLGVTDELARAAWISDTRNRTGVMESSIISEESPAARLLRLLEILVNASNSAGGFLYLVRGEGPVLSAQSGPRAPSIELGLRASKYLLEETSGNEHLTTDLGEENEKDGDTNWIGKEREAYHPVLLAHYTSEGYAITGLALLLKDPSKLFIFPAKAVTLTSKSLLESGEVSKVLFQE